MVCQPGFTLHAVANVPMCQVDDTGHYLICVLVQWSNSHSKSLIKHWNGQLIMIELMLVLWDLTDSRDIVSKLSLMRITSTAASLFADFYHTESLMTRTNTIALLVHHFCIKNCWFWFTVAHLRMCVAFFTVRLLWSRDLAIHFLFLFFGIKSISNAS